MKPYYYTRVQGRHGSSARYFVNDHRRGSKLLICVCYDRDEAERIVAALNRVDA